jgi:hypothetical protein
LRASFSKIEKDALNIIEQLKEQTFLQEQIKKLDGNK